MSHEAWSSPLVDRYASPQMAALLANRHKFRTWRRLWLRLAEIQAELGVPITEAQLHAMRNHIEDIDADAVARHEARLRHDVMAHVHAWGEQIPEARPVIHLGATSCFVGDNTDLLVLRDGLDLVLSKVAGTIAQLAQFARRWADEPTLGFTHFQPAQLTTVGKRACLWLQELLLDLENLTRARDDMRFRGAKGAVGTQATFLALFDGDHARVEELDRRLALAFGFERTYPVVGQTYTRKVDHQVVSALASFCATAHKIATDLRLLAHLREVDEPFGAHQIGSSAMPHKRNPMRSERICSLARHGITLASNTAHTAATQWFERTLDDSANRRITLAESLLTADGVLELLLDVTKGLLVYPEVIRRRINEELPFLATQSLVVAMVQAGADRQDVHERLRVHSHEAARMIKEHGQPSDLVNRILADPAFAPIHQSIDRLLDPRTFVGRAPAQTRAFLDGEVAEALVPWKDRLPEARELRV